MYKRVIAVLVIFGMSVSSASMSQHDTDKRLSSLKGLKAVYVLVDYEALPEQEYGLTKEELKEEVQLRLNANGIKVLTEKEWHQTKGKPYLYINVNGNSTAGKEKKTNTYFFAIGIGLIQDVNLTRKPRLDAEGCTWSRGYTVTVPRGELRMVNEKVGELVFEFIQAVKDANLRRRVSLLGGVLAV